MTQIFPPKADCLQLDFKSSLLPLKSSSFFPIPDIIHFYLFARLIINIPIPSIICTIMLILPFFFFLLLHTPLSVVQAVPATICRDTCGSISIKFPLGTGEGCGHPHFTNYIKCKAESLQFSTSLGTYTISSIDYSTNTLIITDPLMSNCTSMQNSGSFGHEPSSPFTLIHDDTFVLLGCSTTSPIFDPNQDLCDTGSNALRVCRGMYSCKGVTGIGLGPNAPISTCCVYAAPAISSSTMATLGSSGYVLDLPKLQCSSYTGIYGYGDNERDPAKWKYGIALQFNTSYQSSDVCKNCEKSGGVCGYTGFDESFGCVCRNGVNTTTSCYGQGYAWNGAWNSNQKGKLVLRRRINVKAISGIM